MNLIDKLEQITEKSTIVKFGIINSGEYAFYVELKKSGYIRTTSSDLATAINEAYEILQNRRVT